MDHQSPRVNHHEANSARHRTAYVRGLKLSTKEKINIKSTGQSLILYLILVDSVSLNPLALQPPWADIFWLNNIMAIWIVEMKGLRAIES